MKGRAATFKLSELIVGWKTELREAIPQGEGFFIIFSATTLKKVDFSFMFTIIHYICLR